MLLYKRENFFRFTCCDKSVAPWFQVSPDKRVPAHGESPIMSPMQCVCQIREKLVCIVSIFCMRCVLWYQGRYRNESVKEFFKCLPVPNGIRAHVINETNLKSAPKTKSMTTHSYAHVSLLNSVSVRIEYTNNQRCCSVFCYSCVRILSPGSIWFTALIPSFHHG